MNCPVCGRIMSDVGSEYYQRLVQDDDTITATYYLYCSHCAKHFKYKEWFHMTDCGFEEGGPE